jgi:hypothetical protein
MKSFRALSMVALPAAGLARLVGDCLAKGVMAESDVLFVFRDKSAAPQGSNGPLADFERLIGLECSPFGPFDAAAQRSCLFNGDLFAFIL